MKAHLSVRSLEVSGRTRCGRFQFLGIGSLLILLTVTRAATGAELPPDVDGFLKRAAQARAANQWDQAEAAHREAVRLADQYKDDRHCQAFTSHALATFLHDRGRYLAAAKEYEAAQTRTAVAFGEKSQPYASVLNNHGQVLSDLGQFENARSVLERSLEIIREIAPSHPHQEVLALNSLAILSRREGKLDQAANYYKQVLKIYGSQATRNPTATAGILCNIAVVLSEQGDGEDAEKTVGHALNLLSEMGLNGGLLHASCLHVQAKVRLARNNLDGARKSAVEATEICIRDTGRQHPKYATYLDLASEVHAAVGRNQEAETGYNEVIAIRSATFGEDHVSLAETLGRRARLSKRLNKADLALKDLDRATKILTEAFGKNVPRQFHWIVKEYAVLLREANQEALAKALEAALTGDR